MITKMVAGVALVAGSLFVASPASAEPDADANLFGGLDCSCSQTVPATGPGASEEIRRGLRGGEAAYRAVRSAPVLQTQ